MEDSETSEEKGRFMRNSFVDPEPGSSSQFQEDHSVLRFLAVAAISAMAAATVARAAAPASPQGVITGKGFLGTGTGTAVTDLTGNAKFPNNPDVVYYYPVLRVECRCLRRHIRTSQQRLRRELRRADARLFLPAGYGRLHLLSRCG
jgi:hypothetical protein